MNYKEFAQSFKCFVCAKPAQEANAKPRADRCNCFNLYIFTFEHKGDCTIHLHIELNKFYRIACTMTHIGSPQEKTSCSLVKFKDKRQGGSTLLKLNYIPDVVLRQAPQQETLEYFENLLVFI